MHFDDVLKESIIDTPQKKLCPELFSGDKLISDVKNKIIDTFNKWKIKFINDVKIIDIFLLGSSTTYQYNDTSDVDVNIVVDMSRDQIHNIYSLLPKGFLIGQHPVNYYLSPDMSQISKSPTLYDIKKNIWIRKPDLKKVIVPEDYALEIARFFMDGVDLRIAELERDKKDLEKLKKIEKNKENYDFSEKIGEEIAKKEKEIKADLDAIGIAHYLLKAFRWEGFSGKGYYKFKIEIKDQSNPNMSLNNIVYKILDKYNYLTKLEKIEKE